MTWCGRIGVLVYRRPWSLGGALWQRPGGCKRFPSTVFHADDNQMKILAKLRDLRYQQSLELPGQET